VQNIQNQENQKENLDQRFPSLFKKGRRKTVVRNLGSMIYYSKVKFKFQHCQVSCGTHLCAFLFPDAEDWEVKCNSGKCDSRRLPRAMRGPRTSAATRCMGTSWHPPAPIPVGPGPCFQAQLWGWQPICRQKCSGGPWISDRWLFCAQTSLSCSGELGEEGIWK